MAKKYGYEAFLEDEKKREEEAKKGQVRYVEAAKASRIQYSLPQYQGKSQNQGKTYQWERDLMANTKIKGAGNSYTKKFDSLTKRMGMTPGQAEEFRKFMDFQEDSQHVDPKLNKDKTIKQNQSLKYARDAHLKTDIIDGILDKMHKTGAKNVQTASMPTTKEPQKASGWDKIKDGAMKALEIIDRPGDAVRTGIKEKAQGRSFWEGAKDGLTGEKNTSGTELNKLIGLDPEKNANQRKISENINSNLLNTFGIGMALNAFAPDKAKDYAATQTPGAATETLLDPLNLVGGAVTKAPRKGVEVLGNGLSRFAKVEGELPTFTGQASNNVLDSLAPAVAQDRTLGGNVASQSDDFFARLLGQETPKPQTKSESLDSFTPDEIPAIEEPTNILDELMFGQRGNGPKARTGFEKGELPRYARDSISDMGTTTLNRVDQLNNAPEGGYNQRLLDIQQEMKANKNLTEDQARAFEEAQKVLDQRKAYEDAHVEQELAPYAPSQQQAAEAQMKWENIVKQSQEEAARIKGEFGKIHVPKGAAEDYPIPPQFRASYGDKASDDIFSFADQMGFSSADEAVQYLQKLDQDSKVKLKDIMPDRSSTVSPSQWDAMEQAARRNFEQSDAGKAIDNLLEDLLAAGRSTDDIEALYQAHKGPNDPATFDEMIKLAELENNAKPVERNIKSMLRDDPRIAEKVKALNALGGTKAPQEPGLNGNYGQGNLQGIDDVLAMLGENSKNVNNSQAPEQVLEQLVRPKSKTEAVNPAPVSDEVAAGADKEPLLRLNMQQFAPSTARSLVETRAPISTQSPIAKITNPVKRTINKFYEGYVNRNHSAKVTEVQSLETAIKRAKADGKVKKVEQLTQRLKTVKKSGSDFDKALGNELASGAAAQNFLNRNFDSLAQTMGGDMKEMSGALEFQMAKNLDYIKRNVDQNYELPEGWDWGDINRIINSGANNAKYGEFINQFRNMTQEWRDIMLDYGLITKETHEALGKNPYYIPMQRDMSQVFDNIDVGYAGIGDKGRGAGNGIVKSLDGGSVETFFKNPLETVIDHSFKLYKNAYRNDTAQQALKMAELDKDGALGLAKEVSEKNKKPGDLTVFVNGQKRYVRLQDDLVRMMNENESVLDLGKIGKVTQLFAALKTRSFEYQTAAAPRDMVQAYVTSQVSNPVRYLGEVFKAIKNKNASAKEVGAYFDKAYNDHVAGVDPAKVLKEFQQKAGNVKTFNLKDPESWKEVGGVVKKILDTPFKPSKFLGQITDEIPREIEVREAERLFMKKNGQKMQNIQTALDDVNRQIEAAQGAPDFSPDSFGVEQLMHQKDKMENMLRQFNQDLKREQIYRGRDVMDYSRMGNSKATKNIIRPWVIFANTTTQSKDKIIRSFIERPGATIAKATTVVAPFVAAEVINHDNMNDSDRKMYDNLPDYIKQFNYIYIKDGTTYAVPKLQELALITNPIEAALKGDSLDDSMRLLMKESLPYQTGNIAQGFGPRDKDTTPTQNMQAPSTVLSPALDILANRKLGFNQKPISFGGFYKGADAEANDWTLDMFKNLMGNNPGADKTQYGVQQYGGDAGKYATYSLDALLDPSNQDKIDEMLRNLNPLQDRMFKKDSRYFKTTPQVTKK